MKTSILMTTAFAAVALFGCDPNQQPIEPGVDGLLATHVSGHLGSYGDCPEQAWENVGTDQPDGARQADADCADDQCGLLNCEGARLTFSLRNDSLIDADGIEAVALFVLGRDGIELVELPIVATLDGQGLAFDGHLAPGAEALLHVEFAGPMDVEALVGAPDPDGDQAWQSGAQLRLLIGADSHEDTGLDTPELYTLPELDT